MKIYLDLNTLQGISLQRLERKIRELRTYNPGASVRDKLTLELVNGKMMIVNKEENANAV